MTTETTVPQDLWPDIEQRTTAQKEIDWSMFDTPPTRNLVINVTKGGKVWSVTSEPAPESRYEAAMKVIADQAAEINKLRAELGAAKADIAMLIQKETDRSND